MNIPNQTFLQLYEVITEQEDITFSESALLCKLIALGNAPKGCIASNDTLAKYMKTSVSSIKRMLKTLKDKGYIIPIYTPKQGFVDDRKIEFTLKTKTLLGVTTGVPQPKYAVRDQQQKPQKPQKPKPQPKPQKPQQNKPVSYNQEALIEREKKKVEYGF